MAEKTPSRLLLLLLSSLLLLLAVPSVGFAQGTMTFDEEEVEEDAEEEEEETDDGGDGTMTFGEEEVDSGATEETAAQTQTVAVVAVPTEALDRSQRIELQQRLRQAVSLDPSYQAQDGAPILSGLEQAGVASCITDSLCLARVGREAGVDRILLGMVEQNERGLTLSVDLFDVSDKLIVEYTSRGRLSNFDAVLEAVEPAMKEIFDIRIEREGPNYGGGSDTGTVQKVLAWSTAGLAVASLGAGIYFGMEASDGEDAILAHRGDDGTFDITQRQAQEMTRDVEDDALTANVFYGASAGLAVISGILFYVESGSEAAQPAGRQAGVLERIDIQPKVGFGEVGLGASFSF